MSFIRYYIERRWQNLIKSDNKIIDHVNRQTKYKFSYWKYQARKMNRAVSEPNIQTIHILGTIILQKSNSFHNLCNFKQRLRPSVESFKPKLINWLYVTKAHCFNIVFTKTDSDLVTVFGTFLVI